LVFQTVVVQPLFQRTPVTTELLHFHLRLERQCRYVLWPAAGVVLLTGLFNVINVLYTTALAGGSVPTAFIRLLSLKLLLVLLMLILQGVQRLVLQPRTVALVARHTPGDTTFPDALTTLRRQTQLCNVVTVGVAVVVLLLGVLL
jgi:hypothetical protein